MKGHGEKLSRKQEQAIAALLQEPTLAAAAARAGVSETSLWRWLKRADFNAAYRAARGQVVEKAVAQLQQGSWAASTTLLKLLGSGSDAVRLRAAVAILEQAHRAIEMTDFAQRLEALEREPQQQEPGPW